MLDSGAESRPRPFGRAAQHLRIAQPAVSTQIRKLEAELGVTLLHRTTRKVELTRAGELFLAHVRAVQDELAAARTDLELLAGGEIGRVRIGAIQALAPFDLPAALAAFTARHPDVELAVRPGRTAELLDDLDQDRVDLAICPVPDDLPERFATALLFVDELVLVTAPDHPAARSGTLPIAALRGERFACLPVGSGLRARLDRSAADAGFTPDVRFETANLPQLRDLVAHGLGVALMARSVAEAPGRPVAVHGVDPGPLWRPVDLLHLRTRPLSPAARACAAFLVRAAHN